MLAFTNTAALAEQQNSTKAAHLATHIADNYLKSFSSVQKEEKQEIEGKKKQLAHKNAPVSLTTATKRAVVFNNIFTKSSIYTQLQQHMAPILNQYAWGDLNLFYGTTSNPGYHLMARMNRTITTPGEGALATLLVTPTSSVQELHQRQNILKALLDHAATLQQLKDSLHNYQASEQSMLSFWTKEDPLYTKEYQKYMNQRFYSETDHAGNKSAGLLEFRKRFFRDFCSIQYLFLWPITIPIAMEIFGSKEFLSSMVSSLGISQRAYLWRKAIPYYGGWYFWKALTGGLEDPPKALLILPILGELLYTWSAYTGISNYLEYSAVLRNLALRMAAMQAFVLAATEISDRIAAFPALEELYGARLQGIRTLLNQAQEKTELGRLVHYLQHLPYQSWSYFFNNAGKLLASHKLLIEHRDDFADAVYEFGQLDAFISMATFMQEAQAYHPEHAYTFTQLVDRSQKQKPYVKLQAMWNPFIDAKVVVDNTVEMDAATNTASNIILTGPNAGGKSTFLTGITISLLLSQTFGIAPAKEAVITPFDKINTYIDITDDIAAGDSLFISEVNRAQKHIHMLSKLKKEEFSFTIFDEPFSGTNPTEGAAAEYSILEAIADHTNTLNIVATHYPIVMLLEKRAAHKGFVNYKVFITRKGLDKKLNYTYKVVPGKSNQAIAIDILEERGYDTKMLQRAREIIEHPENYQATF